MSTNYYLETALPCPHCGRGAEQIHIGLSAAGWVFQLHAIPERGINSLEDWVKAWQDPTYAIKDEYDRPVSREDMYGRIAGRSQGLHRTDGLTGDNLPTYEMVQGEFS